MAKKKVSTFDELKDPDLEYRYSREERLKNSRARIPDTESRKATGFARIFGRSKSFSKMFIFFLLICGFMWIYFYANRTGLAASEKQSFTLSNDVKVSARLISTESRHGLNIVIKNESKESETPGELSFVLGDFEFSTNIGILMESDETLALFCPISESITDLTSLSLKGAPE